MTLESNLKNKIITVLLLVCYPVTAFADPEVNGELLPPGEAIYVTDSSILSKLNLGPSDEPVWCYSNLANSLIITSADREREKCQLKLKQELKRAQVNCTFETDRLSIQLDSLQQKHDKLLSLKDQQIEELTTAALKRPNDYSAWWATGGLAVGVLSTLAIVFAVK